MDIHRNPGPNYTASNLQEFEFRVNNRNEANLHASTRRQVQNAGHRSQVIVLPIQEVS